MQNIANFLVECGGLLDEAQEQQITQLSWIINGSVYGTRYTAPQLASILGMDAGQMQRCICSTTAATATRAAGRCRCSSL